MSLPSEVNLSEWTRRPRSLRRSARNRVLLARWTIIGEAFQGEYSHLLSVSI